MLINFKWKGPEMMVEIQTETGSFNKNQKHKVVLTVYIWYYWNYSTPNFIKTEYLLILWLTFYSFLLEIQNNTNFFLPNPGLISVIKFAKAV